MTSVGAGTMDNPNHILYPPWHVVVVSSILRALDENIINEPFLFVHNDDGYRTNERNDSCDSLGGNDIRRRDRRGNWRSNRSKKRRS
jgi:hypothetical protein